MNTSPSVPSENESATPAAKPVEDTDGTLIPVRTPTGDSAFMSNQDYAQWLLKRTKLLDPPPSDKQP